MTYWRTDPTFEFLSDELAKDRVVFLTGAGISINLKTADGNRLPSWLNLLRNLRSELDSKGQLGREDLDDLNTLLEGEPAPDSSHFLEAATILANAQGAGFEALVADQTRSGQDATSETHVEIQACAPRAVVTFNYDLGHEAAHKRAAADGEDWTTILAADPDVAGSEAKIRQALKPEGMRRVLVKAHGSVDVPPSLVLTGASYREVLARRPAYRALLNHIMLNFTVVAIGFGMDDPDFQSTLDMIERDIGSSLRKHVYFTLQTEATPTDPNEGAKVRAALRKEIIRKRRFGFVPLKCRNWSDLPLILKDLQTHPGPELLELLVAATADPIQERSNAHLEMSRLSRSGASRLIGLIEAQLNTTIDDRTRAEYCYSLGRIRPKDQRAKRALKRCIQERHGVKSTANAVIGFIEYADEGDIEWLKEQLEAWEASPPRAAGGKLDPSNRVPVYLKYAIQKTTAKHAPWNR